MVYVQHKHETSRAGLDAKTENAAVSSRKQNVLRRAEQMAAAGNYDKAVDLLHSTGSDRQLVNAMGVYLMRMGRYDDAARLFRGMVLKQGCTWMKPDLPTVYKTNYATALLLAGHPNGCLEVLGEIGEQANVTIERLRAAIRKWETQLSFWQKFNWRLGGLEPVNRPVSLDFPPGDLEVDFANSEDRSPG